MTKKAFKLECLIAKELGDITCRHCPYVEDCPYDLWGDGDEKHTEAVDRIASIVADIRSGRGKR